MGTPEFLLPDTSQSRKDKVPDHNVSAAKSHGIGNHGSCIQTTWEAFPDGTMLDLVRDAADGKVKLLKWDGKHTSVLDQFQKDGNTYIPASICPSILRAMRLPTRVAPFGSTRELFDAICRILTRLNDLAERTVTALAYFVLATCLQDRVIAAPFVSIVVAPTAPGGALLHVLTLLCRRALLLGDVSAARLRALPMHLGPTLLLDIVQLEDELCTWLRASSRRGMYVPSRGGALDQYCAKVVCAPEALSDPSLLGLALQVEVAPPRRPLPMPDRETSEQIADEFQAKLQMYRFASYSYVGEPKIDVADLTAPMQDLSRSLAACVVGDADLQFAVVPLLRPQDQQLRAERAALIEAIILEALWIVCHEKNRQWVSVGELTTDTNTILAGRGESLTVSNESVGWKLKSLGLQTESLPGGNKGLFLLAVTKARIHALAKAFGVRTLDAAAPGLECPHCAGQPKGQGEEEGKTSEL